MIPIVHEHANLGLVPTSRSELFTDQTPDPATLDRVLFLQPISVSTKNVNAASLQCLAQGIRSSECPVKNGRDLVATHQDVTPVEIAVRRDEWFIWHFLLGESLSLLLQLLDECLDRYAFEEIIANVLFRCMTVVANLSVVAGQDIISLVTKQTVGDIKAHSWSPLRISTSMRGEFHCQKLRGALSALTNRNGFSLSN
jgi:hypothetical protein